MASSISGAANSLASLLRQTTLDDHEEVLKAANAQLKKSKSDLEAQHVKAVALLNLERYDDVVKLFEDSGDKLKERARLEYAYALYRAGHQAEAVKIAEAAGEDGHRGMRHVLAQAVCPSVYSPPREQSTDYGHRHTVPRISPKQRRFTKS